MTDWRTFPYANELPDHPGWDGYSTSKAITPEARDALHGLSVVPLSNGGLQIEFHAAGLDVEIEVPPDGKRGSVWIGQEKSHE